MFLNSTHQVRRPRLAALVLLAVCLAATAGPVAAQEYLGCFRDGEDRLFDVGPHSYPSLTIERCVTDCRESGFAFAGVQVGHECFCSHRFDSGWQRADNCDWSCQGDGSQRCGGSWALSVYSVEGLPGPPSGYDGGDVKVRADAVDALAGLARALAASQPIADYFTSGRFERDLRSRDASAVGRGLGTGDRVSEARSVAGPFRTLTIGLVQAAGVGVGFTLEAGIALPLHAGGTPYFYQSYGLDGGFIDGVTLGLSLGLHVAEAGEICGEGKAVSASLTPPGVPLSVGGGFGFGVLPGWGGLLADGRVQSVFAVVGVGHGIVDTVSLKAAPSANFQTSSTMTVVAGSAHCRCGEQGERPCTLVERVPSCNDGLGEDFARHLCVERQERQPIEHLSDVAPRSGPNGMGIAEAVREHERMQELLRERQAAIPAISFTNRSMWTVWFEVDYQRDGQQTRWTSTEFGSGTQRFEYQPGDVVTSIRGGFLDVFVWTYWDRQSYDKPAAEVPQSYTVTTGPFQAQLSWQ